MTNATQTTYAFEFNGFTITRTSFRTYTHAQVTVDPYGVISMSCAGSEELARKAEAYWRARFAVSGLDCKFYIVPLIALTGAEAKAAKAREKAQRPEVDKIRAEAQVKHEAWRQARKAAK